MVPGRALKGCRFRGHKDVTLKYCQESYIPKSFNLLFLPQTVSAGSD